MSDTTRRLRFWVVATAPDDVSLENPVAPYLIDRRLRDILSDLGYEPHHVSWDEETKTPAESPS